MERAEYTIDLLNLNSGFLQTERRNHWEELEQLFEEHIEKGWDLQQLLQLELVLRQIINCMNSSALHASFPARS